MKFVVFCAMVVIVTSPTLVCNVSRHPDKVLPPVWSKMCRSETSGNMSYIAIACHLTADDSWDLTDFRNWSATLSVADQFQRSVNDTRVSVDITCGEGGSVCLPWPYRAIYLDSLKVRNCHNKCYLDDYANPEVLETIPDRLRVFEGYDITVQTTIKDLININIKEHPPILDCGPLSAEVFVNQGSRTEFIVDVLSTTTVTDNITDTLTSTIQAVGDLEHMCRYRNMKIYDVSRKIDASSSSLYTTVVNAFFPQLQTLNLSSTELQSFPRAFKIWRKRFPKLKTLDLSYNNISRFDLTDSVRLSTLDNINLTHNNIQTIGNPEIRSFTLESGMIDVTDNPLRCDCSMADFNKFLQKHKSPTEAGVNPRYSYLWTLTCVTPTHLRGRQIAGLTRSTLCNEDVTAYNSAIYVLSSIAAVLVLVAVAVPVVIACTRCHRHIRLGKGKPDDNQVQDVFKTEEAEEENI